MDDKTLIELQDNKMPSAESPANQRKVWVDIAGASVVIATSVVAGYLYVNNGNQNQNPEVMAYPPESINFMLKRFQATAIETEGRNGMGLGNFSKRIVGSDFTLSDDSDQLRKTKLTAFVATVFMAHSSANGNFNFYPRILKSLSDQLVLFDPELNAKIENAKVRIVELYNSEYYGITIYSEDPNGQLFEEQLVMLIRKDDPLLNDPYLEFLTKSIVYAKSILEANPNNNPNSVTDDNESSTNNTTVIDSTIEELNQAIRLHHQASHKEMTTNLGRTRSGRASRSRINNRQISQQAQAYWRSQN